MTEDLRGWLVKDKANDAEVIVWGQTEFLLGCEHLAVRPRTIGRGTLMSPGDTYEAESISFEKMGDAPLIKPVAVAWFVELGQYAEDIMTGFKGIVFARTSWLSGNTRVALIPDRLNKEGRPAEIAVFDQTQIKITSKKKNFLASLPERPGASPEGPRGGVPMSRGVGKAR